MQPWLVAIENYALTAGLSSQGLPMSPRIVIIAVLSAATTNTSAVPYPVPGGTSQSASLNTVIIP